jgi:hypothetical protein
MVWGGSSGCGTRATACTSFNFIGYSALRSATALRRPLKIGVPIAEDRRKPDSSLY